MARSEENGMKMKTELELPGLANRLDGEDGWKKGVKPG